MPYTQTEVDRKYTELKSKHELFIVKYKDFIDNNKMYLNTSDIPLYFLKSNLNMDDKTATNASALEYPSS